MYCKVQPRIDLTNFFFSSSVMVKVKYAGGFSCYKNFQSSLKFAILSMECRYAECHYAECRGAMLATRF